MTEPDQALVARMSSDLATMTAYLARASADLRELERMVGERTARPVYRQPPVVAPAPPPPPQPPAPRPDGWIGKALAVAGVAVTLVGVALLLVLAAQAGFLSPGVRVAAGAALAVALVAVAWRLVGRPGGRVGAISLAATGVAAAYVDVIAVTELYHWVSAPAGLAIAAVLAVSGLVLARLWDAEPLGLLVLVPLIGLGPVVADGVGVVLVGFMLALGAASLLIQLGRDWLGMHAARTAVTTLPLLLALVVTSFDSGRSPLLAVAGSLAAVLAVGGASTLLPHTRRKTAMAVLSAMGTTPVLAASLAVDGAVAATLAAVLAAALLGIVLTGGDSGVRAVWSALAAVSAFVAVTVAFDGPVAGPVLLAMGIVTAIAGRRRGTARRCALGFGVAGGVFLLAYAPPSYLVEARELTAAVAASTLVASLLLAAWAVITAWSLQTNWAWAVAAVVALYAITTFTVTAGVLTGGENQGFRAGHVAATLCWIILAAAVLRHAVEVSRDERSLPIGGGMALVAAAVAKLFLFDLGTLDGIFRVAVFIAVGLVLLGMGTGYARRLAQRDGRRTRV
ncbi:DUF2339 domain-containing protein [Mycolicibacterium sp. P1-18]|uniref:DUF2339 domain-containing protein n=1 Tax=Mycolicibacterium sp. P1-18 TaxID=2024615 RepID=UPI0011F1A0F6|nr:DUF2339 domain-containing protein [Mycolicibacterium sp. P1-18]KAA0096156.1 DUF2339 domain-containing protein [Mycolicibacterium sp. P1-18]